VPIKPVPVFTFWDSINFCIVFLLYIPIVIAVYWHAQGRGESGFFWAVLCTLLPGLGVVVYITWIILQAIGDRKSGTRLVKGLGTPDLELSRQRLLGRGFASRKYDDIETFILTGELDEAEELVSNYLKEAEEIQDGVVIADMIAYKERLKKEKRK
jgi:hypothetical protein